MRSQVMKIDLVKMAIIALTIKVMFSSSVIVPWNPYVDNICVGIGITAFLVKIWQKNFRLSQFLAMCFMGLLVAYTCVSMKQYDLLVTFIAVYLLQNEDIDEYIQLIFTIEVAIIVTHLLITIPMSLVGASELFWSQMGTRIRFNGGFQHPNILSSYILSCMMMYVWKNFGKMTLNKYAWLLLVTIFSYGFTNSRTSLLLDVLLIIIVFVGHQMPLFMGSLLTPFLRFAFPFFSVFVYWTQKNYHSGNFIIQKVDTILSGRLKYAAYGYDHSGTTILPRFIDYAESGIVTWDPTWNLNTFTFDNVYSFMIVQMGIIWIFVVSIIIIYMNRNMDFKCRVFIMIWILFSMTEVHGLNGFKFFPILLLSVLVSDKELEDDYEEDSEAADTEYYSAGL